MCSLFNSEVMTAPSRAGAFESWTGSGITQTQTSSQPAAGDRCTAPRRVGLLSPSPDRLYPLIMELYRGCCDLFLMHQADESLLGTGPVDLLIVDETLSEEAGSTSRMASWLRNTGLDIPALILVRDRQQLTRIPAELRQQQGVWFAVPQEAWTAVQTAVRGPRRERETGILTFKDLVVDEKRMSVTRGQIPLSLTKTEYDLLRALLAAEGAVLTREELIHRIWSSDFYGGSNVVDAHMKSLRKKLGDSAAAPKYILTVRGAGYRLADDSL
ncbi:winged helix-turn-helix transcriptional regulator [Paenibacillus sp. S-38]|uniref:winged helix-turn-helix transcriptional regulator n=1 Tax=Paenibacillus sp. S-38 TaxID=3416710 RepID=UPI003CE6EE7C